jgi:hypothetical protein
MKWPLVRNKLEESCASIICFQETKKLDFDSSFIKKFAPRRFDNFAFIPAEGASGGLLILWVGSLFSGRIMLEECFGLAVEFTSHLSAEVFTLVNVYGPCSGIARENFVAWLFHLDFADDALWLILGDFNFYRFVESRNKQGQTWLILQLLMTLLVILGSLNSRSKDVLSHGATCKWIRC